LLTVEVLQLFPIKGLDPIEVQAAQVLPSGALAYDRRWALFDARDRPVNGKNRPEVHTIRAEYDLIRMEVSLEGHICSLAHGAGAIAEWFSERLGERVQFRENRTTGFPDDLVSPGPTVVSAASLATVAEWHDLAADEARRRFRTNIEFSAPEPFWEDRLYGSTLKIGPVDLQCVNPCQRCVVPSRNSRTGEPDRGFQKLFAENREMHMPHNAQMSGFTHYYRFALNTRLSESQAEKWIRLGDHVRMA
jgi:uncharacterized protein YcbX